MKEGPDRQGHETKHRLNPRRIAEKRSDRCVGMRDHKEMQKEPKKQNSDPGSTQMSFVTGPMLNDYCEDALPEVI